MANKATWEYKDNKLYFDNKKICQKLSTNTSNSSSKKKMSKLPSSDLVTIYNNCKILKAEKINKYL